MWAKYHTIVGRPGTGKSQVLIRVMQWSTAQEYNVLLTAPTAILGSLIQSRVPKCYSMRYYSSCVCVPIRAEDQHRVDYSLAWYDLLVIDKASMVSTRTLQYIAFTLKNLVSRPLVFVRTLNSYCH